MKTIILSGGGSGGHVMPLIAVAQELKKQYPSAKIVYIGQKGDRFGQKVAESGMVTASHFIYAGKFRRYHGESKIRQFFDISTQLKNARDVVYLMIGTLQSYRIMRKYRPSLFFSKGGFVAVPAGLAAHFCKVPIATHDSDAHPGLANRIVGRWAVVHAVALPATNYPYPAQSIRVTGVPINTCFKPVDAQSSNTAKKQIGLPDEAKLLFIAGGGLGSLTINNALLSCLPELLAKIDNLYIIALVGDAHADEIAQKVAAEKRITVIGHTKNQEESALYGAAADVVVTRSGATAMAEFAMQAKPVIIIPSPFLTGGHQLMNAEVYNKAGAAIIVHEQGDEPLHVRMCTAIQDLLGSPERMRQLASALQQFAKPNATRDLVAIIAEASGLDERSFL